MFSKLEAETDGFGPFNVLPAQGNIISYGGAEGYTLKAGIDQVTKISGTLKDNAPAGTYTMVTEVKQGNTVIASSSFDYVVGE